MTEPQAAAAVMRTRRVHYFSGFDPRGARHYHRMCREEGVKPQPDGSALQVGVRERLSAGLSRWRVEWKAHSTAQTAARTEHVFMGWDDVVRAHWSRSPLALLREFIKTYVYIFRNIGAARVWRMYPPAFKAGALPLVIFLVPLLVAAISWVIHPVAGSVALVLVVLAWWLAVRSGVPWLVRIYTFFMRMGTAPVQGLEARTRQWVETVITMQQAEPADEVLLVGHSVGTLVMVDTVDTLLQDARWQALSAGKPTHMLTLGQSCPMVAMAPVAHGFRAALQRLSHHPQLCWWDVTARIDPLCFYHLHPLAQSGTPHEQAPLPVLHAARFMHMYTPARWARLRANKLQAHFLYLMTSDKPGNFSWADVFYGPRTLQQQIAAKGAPAHE